MENTQIFRILSLCAAVLAVTAQPSIRLEVNGTDLAPGNELKFACIAENLVGGTSFLRIEKKLHADSEADALEISTNTILNSDLKPLGRYSVTYEAGKNSNELRFIFTATDIRYEDAGEYTCAIMGGQGVIASDVKMINVVNVVDFVVEMTVTRANGEAKTYSNMDEKPFTYELDEHEKFHVLLTTAQTNPAPQVSFMVGRQVINDQFVEEVLPTEFNDESGLLTGVKYSVKAEGDINVDHSYKSGFSAVARVADKEETVRFNVKFSGYPPTFSEECTRNIMAGKHELDVEFTCKIQSAEPIDVFFTYFRETGETEETKGEILETIKPGDQDPGADYHYTATLFEDRDNEEYNVRLQMPHMYPQMFKEYTLVASNSKGNTTHMFTIEEDESRSKNDPDTSSASQISIAVSSLLMIILAAML